MNLERIGARVYVRGAEFGHRDVLKAAGAKWDPEQRAWWAGVAKTKSYGRRDRRSDRIDYPTIGSLAAYAERMRRDLAGRLTQLKQSAHKHRATLATAEVDIDLGKHLAGDEAGLTPTRRCWECGRAFTAREARQNDGDWSDSYCGC